MKKFTVLILSTLLAVAVPFSARAASFRVGLSGPATFESTATLSLSLNNYSDISLEYGGIMAMTMDVSYDESKININISGQNGFAVTRNGSRLVIDRDEGAISGTTFAIMNVTNRALVNNELTTITLSNIVGSDSDKNAFAGTVSKTITFVKNEPTATTPTPNPTTSTTSMPSQTSESTSMPSANNIYKNNKMGEETETLEAIIENENVEEENDNGSENNLGDQPDEEEQNEPINEEPKDNSAPIIATICTIVFLAIGISLSIFIAKKKQNKKN